MSKNDKNFIKLELIASIDRFATEIDLKTTESAAGIYYGESHSGRLVRKSMHFSWFFEEISSPA